MPAYDFKCSVCNETFEIVRSLSEDGPVRCPSCDGAAKRVFTPVGVHFKGSGFHNTDYRTKPVKSEPASEPACAKADSGSSACSSCPAAAAE